MREIGIFSWFGYDLPLHERFDLIASAGFESTCLWLGPEESLVADDQADDMPGLARQSGLKIDNVHASPSGCNGLWAETDGDAPVDAYRNAITFCRRHAIPRAVVHVTQGSDPPTIGPRGLERIHELARITKAEGIALAVENGGRPDYVDFILSQCEDASLGLCYDSSHDFLKGMPPTDILRKWGHRLVTVHFSDNHCEQDDHLLPGDGTIDWEAVTASFPTDTYTGPIMLEVVPDPQERIDPNEFLLRAYSRARKIERRLG